MDCEVRELSPSPTVSWGSIFESNRSHLFFHNLKLKACNKYCDLLQGESLAGSRDEMAWPAKN